MTSMISNPPLRSAIQRPEGLQTPQRVLTAPEWATWLQSIANILIGQTESGTTAQRPTKGLYVGRRYFDTTLGYPVWYDGNSWIAFGDATLPINLTTDVTGVLPVANGGTNMNENVAFLAYSSAGSANVTGAGTVATVVLDAEDYDLGGDFASNTFTAPADGYYPFDFSIIVNQITTALATSVAVQLVTSNHTYRYTEIAAAGILPTDFTRSAGVLAYMDSGDTALINVQVSGMAGDTADVVGATGSLLRTYFSGCRWR